MLKSVFDSIGKITLFGARAVRDAWVPPFEGEYLLKQLYEIGVGSFLLVVASGFALGVVMTLHTRSTLVQFGATAEIPIFQSPAFFNEIGPLVAALLMAGRVGAGIGAQLANMRATEQIDVETEGLVGDKFVLIHSGTDRAPEAPPGSTLLGKEPFDMTKLLEQAQGIMNQAGTTITQLQGTMKDVSGHVDTTLDTANSTIKNVNGVVLDVRAGKGTAGLLLEDKATAADVRQSIASVRQTTGKLNDSTTRVDNLLADVQSRQLVPKLDDTLNNAKVATQNLDQTTQQINTTLKSAFGEDQYGEDAGAHLQQSLTNFNQASGNLTDDTEALKHEFFFKGFFKHRGYDSLDDLPVEQYRAGKIFKSLPESREWIVAPSLFATNQSGEEVLSAEGRRNIDQAVGQLKEIYGKALIVEGYASTGSPSDELVQSRRRATLVLNYLQLHYHLQPKDIGIVALRSTPPESTGKPAFDGVSLVSVGRDSK